ncbi:MAG: porin [Chitinophagales bacterium]
MNPRLLLSIFLLLTNIGWQKAMAQQTLTDSLRNRAHQEVLDSLRRENVGVALSKAISISGYLEVYFSYDFAKPKNHLRQPFAYSHNRHNQFNVNLGVVKLALNKERVRANIALMLGTYSSDNLADEPSVLKNIYEANVGLRLARRHAIWLDAGVMPSHIGFESAIGKDCWNVTRSILADNTPYYETGVRLSYTSANEKWYISGLLVNSWQRIYRPDGSNFPAFGHQLTFHPNSNITVNSSSFFGFMGKSGSGVWRLFHNAYVQAQLHEKVGLIAGFDIGAQQKKNGSSNYSLWYTPIAILRITPLKQLALAARAEYYSDAQGVMIAYATPHGFQTWGYSINIDYQIWKNVLWRLEARGFTSRDAVFQLQEKPSANNYFITTALAVWI